MEGIGMVLNWKGQKIVLLLLLLLSLLLSLLLTLLSLFIWLPKNHLCHYDRAWLTVWNIQNFNDPLTDAFSWSVSFSALTPSIKPGSP